MTSQALARKTALQGTSTIISRGGNMSQTTQMLPESLAPVWCEHLLNSALLPQTQTGEDNRAWTLCFTRRMAAAPSCTPAVLNNGARGQFSVQARLLQSTLRTQCRHDRIGPLPPRSPLLSHTSTNRPADRSHRQRRRFREFAASTAWPSACR